MTTTTMRAPKSADDRLRFYLAKVGQVTNQRLSRRNLRRMLRLVAYKDAMYTRR